MFAFADQYGLLHEGGVLVDSVRGYLLSITAAAFICSIINALTPKDCAQRGIVRMMCGLFLAITAISPFTSIKINQFHNFWSDMRQESDQIVMQGESMANNAYCDIIKDRSEAYILDKASVMGLNIEVEVTLSDTVPSSPYSVEIAGAISPYSKRKLQEMIANDLAIPEERQKWT